MTANDIEHALERLVEADRARSDATRAISDYQAERTEPPAPPVFEDIRAFLAFHSVRQGYYVGLRQEEAARFKAEEAYRQAADSLSSVLPSGSRLFYTYEGNSVTLRGVTFVIENQGGKIVILNSSGPAP